VQDISATNNMQSPQVIIIPILDSIEASNSGTISLGIDIRSAHWGRTHGFAVGTGAHWGGTLRIAFGTGAHWGGTLLLGGFLLGSGSGSSLLLRGLLSGQVTVVLLSSSDGALLLGNLRCGLGR